MTDATVPAPYKLMRARQGRMLGGVAAGLAKASGLDVAVVRICIGATVLTFGLGVPAYILMWVVLPEESPRRGRVIEPAPEGTARGIRVAIFATAGLSVLNQLGDIGPFSNPRADGFGWGGLLGLILLGIGVSVLFSRHRPDRTWWEPPSPPSSASTTSRRPPAPAGDDNYDVVDDEDPPTYVGPFRDVVAPISEAVSEAFREARTTLAESRPSRSVRATASTGYVDDDDLDYLDYGDPYYADPPRPTATVTVTNLSDSGGFALGFARVVGWIAVIWFVLSAICVTAGWLFGALNVTKPVVLGGAAWLVFTAVINTLLHARFARAIIPALALLLIPVAIAGATVRPVGSVGHQIAAPDNVATETKNYRHAVGRLDLDFGDTTFEKATTIKGRTGVGAIFVEVPKDAELVVNTRIGLGGYEILGRRNDGARPRDRLTFDGCEGGPKLTLELRTGIGHVEVKRKGGKTEPTCGTKAAEGESL